jgi:DNA-binding NtrC family response regulator
MARRHGSLPPRTRRRDGANDTLLAPALLLVHPVPTDPDDILAIAVHLLARSTTAQGKEAAILSQDAALFLTRHRWGLKDLAIRISRAVACNEGSLITAADLC